MQNRIIAALLLVLMTAASAQERSQSGLELNSPRPMVDEPVRAPKAMVSSINELATDSGLAVLRRGGNAVDAAIAVAVALSVVHPEAGNLGGSGHMLIRMHDGRTAAIDYSGTAPTAARSDTPQKELLIGYKSAVVPGTPAGLGLAHDRFGKLSWRECLEPAYRLANRGFPASQRMELILKLQVPVMKYFPETAKVLLHGSDKPLKEGEWVVQPELAATIKRMQVNGWREFYEGKTARLIASAMASHGGWITAADMHNYQAELHEPIRTTYRGYTILTIPPAASGGVTLADALNVLEQTDLPLGSEGSSMTRHYQLEALRCGFQATRALNESSAGLQLAYVVSLEYARKQAATIEKYKATPVPAASVEGHDSKETTDFSVVDAEGNMVTNTYTLSGFYGSQVMVSGTGVILNNSMSVFSRSPASKNYLTPGQRYITTLADTIIINPDGTPWVAFGSPGGGTIPSTVLEVVSNLIDFKMSLRDAIEYPRVHFDLLKGTVEAEPGALVQDVATNLQTMGYRLDPKLRAQGDVDAVMIDPETGWRIGASDGRRGGSAKGY